MSDAAQTAAWSESTTARITPDHIERARFLIGYDEPSSVRQPVTTPSEDSIRLFAMSYGSDNPLHCDADYARKTRWGGVVAPGPMVNIMGTPLKGDPRPEAIARAKKGLLKNIHMYHSGTEWEWYGPIRAGDTIYNFKGEESVQVKTSEFGGVTVLRTSRTVYMNQRAEVVAVVRLLIVHSERKTAANRGKYRDIPPASYTAEDIAAIDAIYAAEQVRGAEPRYWEDVEVGDSLGVMAKGPLTVSDIIAQHMTGLAETPFGPSMGRLGYQRRRKMPAAYSLNPYGIPDLVMRVHWDDEWSREVGHPRAYDYGLQREFWLYHYLTDWCGDDGIVLRMGCDIRKFNYIGDTQTLTGEITARRVEDDGRTTVDVAVRFENQRGEQTTTGHATVALPSRAQGQARYAEPPADLSERAQAIMARHRELSAG
jgi:acyl dehydratase